MAKEIEKKSNAKDKKKEAKSNVTTSKKTTKVTTARKDVAKNEKKSSKTATKSKKEKVVNKNEASKQEKPVSTKSKKTTSSANKRRTSSRKTSAMPKTTAKPMLAEYYDLPYRYNETTVKILAQTPTTLFVYWDISDDDRNSLISKYGENVFYETKPILVVHNITKNKSFEIEINDFANSWYIRTQVPNCNYTIELGRRKIDKPEEYIYIYSSNNIVSPNDHILFEKTDLGKLVFRNIKTNKLSSKDFGSLRFMNYMDKLYGNIYDVYSRLYKDELINELTMPTSGGFRIR